MSQFLTALSFGNSLVPLRNEYRVCQPNYSTRWWLFGQDMLWTRSRFVQVASSVSNFFWDMYGPMDVWDWDLVVSSEGNVGARRDQLTGITLDSTGAPLTSVLVKAFDLARDLLVDTTTSDSVTGAFSVSTPYTGSQMYCYCYKAGTPVQGATAYLTPS